MNSKRGKKRGEQTAEVVAWLKKGGEKQFNVRGRHEGGGMQE